MSLFLGLVVLGGVRKITEYEPEGQTCKQSALLHVSVSVLDSRLWPCWSSYLLWVFSIMDCGKDIKIKYTFLYKVCFGNCFIRRIDIK